MKLSEPSRDLARRVLAEVDFNRRLVGYKMHRRAGPSPLSLYSFEEVVGLLLHPLSQIDFSELEQWVREVMQDPELADRIREQRTRNVSAMRKTANIRDLMAKRLIQCGRVNKIN